MQRDIFVPSLFLSVIKETITLICKAMTKAELLQELDYLKNVMISVSTGGQRIEDVNEKYQATYRRANEFLKSLKIENPNTFSDLWEWYGRWSDGSLPTYQERRTFINNLFKLLHEQISNATAVSDSEIEIELTGWDRIERSITEIKSRMASAITEEQFQAIGLLCRETLISLAQEVFVREKHPPLDSVEPSKTDSKRMLDAYIAVELAGGSNETSRKYAKSTLGLADELVHKRTATKKDARLCATATFNLVSIIRIVTEE